MTLRPRALANGFIAIGKTANGTYALSRSGKGKAKYMLSPDRRDEEAVRLFSLFSLLGTGLDVAEGDRGRLGALHLPVAEAARDVVVHEAG